MGEIKNFRGFLRSKAESMYAVAVNDLSNNAISKYFNGNTEELISSFRQNASIVPFDDVKSHFCALMYMY